MTLEALKAQLEEVRVTAKTNIAENVQIAKIKAEIEILSSEAYQRASTKLQQDADTNIALDNMDALCSMIVEKMPIYNNRTRQNNKWNIPFVTKIFNDTYVDRFLTIIDHIKRADSAHQVQMLAAINLAPEAFNTIVNSLGQQHYYNKDLLTIVPGEAPNARGLRDILSIIQLSLGLYLNLSVITQNKADTYFNKCVLNAEAKQLADAKTLAMASLKLD